MAPAPSPRRDARKVEAELAKRRKVAEGQARKAVKAETKMNETVASLKRRPSGPTKTDCITALRKHGSQLAAAKALGITRNTFRYRLGYDQ